MSKNSVPSANDPRKITSQRLSQGPPPALANTGNPRPPVFFVTSDLKNVLNYSFQTGEEFALEFIQDRANTRKTSVLTISEDPGVHATGEKPREKMMSHPAFADISGQGSSKSFAAESYDIAPAKMKFLCNFGGRFLPRPGDGQLRYVGGERHLLWISKDMSWQELTEKTAGLYRRAHAIKYHLPGENVNVLISVASDEDLHHMIDECVVLHATEEKPAMYLVSLDDDGEHHVHYVVESTDADVEAQFIAAVNGFAGSGEALSAFGSASANDIDTDHLMFGMEDDVSSSMKSKPSLGGAAMPSRTSSRVPSGARPGRASSVPSEFTCPNKREQRAKTAAKPQTAGLQWTNTNVIERVQRGGILRTQERSGASRRELLISLDDSGSKQQFPSPTSRLGDNPGARAGRVEKAGPLIQLSQPDDSTGFQKLEPHNMSEGLLANPPDSKILVIQAGCASVSDGSEKPVYRHLRSDDTMMMKPRRYCSQEVAATDQISKQQHDKMQMADPSHLTDCNDSGGLAPWHDDMFLEPAVESVTDSSQQTGSDGEIVHSPHPLTSSDSNATSLRNGEKKSSSSIAKEDAERSESPGNDANSPRARNQSQEAKKNIAPPIPKLKSTDSSKSANEALGRELVKSNVQIINNEDLEDLRELGAGAFGTVFHGRWKGTDVAIKRIKNSCFTYPSSQADKLISEFWREADIISKLHHPNVLAFYGVVNNGPGGTLATVTEFMVSGSLKKVLLRKDRYLDRRKRLMLAMDVAIGMEYLHTKSIIHFDLKCDNLLVNLKDLSRPICKVADFGLSKMKQTTMVSGGMRGTLPWMAPELLTMGSNKVSEKVDLYSFGIVMWEILTGEEPYAGMHYGEVIGGIMSNKLRPPVPTYCDPEWRKLMEQCWSTEPEQRPTFTEVAIRLRSMLEASQGQPVSLFAMP